VQTPLGRRRLALGRRPPGISPGLDALLAGILPIAACAVLIAALYSRDLDRRITSWFYDPVSGQWPWRGHWLTKELIHDRGRDLVFLIALGCIAVAALGGRSARLRPLRRSCFFVLLSILLSAGAASLLKSISPDPSPWFAAEFGGDIVHGTLFASHSPTGELGRGSPGAHATGAFALMSLYYVWRGRSIRRAWFYLVAGWLLGSLYGADQVIRGAHFPSHNYWSCILAWCICTLLYWGPFRGRLGEPEPVAP
jgi:membrane-associated PAP2 superfamily phosphatase